MKQRRFLLQNCLLRTIPCKIQIKYVLCQDVIGEYKYYTTSMYINICLVSFTFIFQILHTAYIISFTVYFKVYFVILSLVSYYILLVKKIPPGEIAHFHLGLKLEPDHFQSWRVFQQLLHFNFNLDMINHADRVEKKIIIVICLKMAPKKLMLNFEDVWQCLSTILTQNIFPEFRFWSCNEWVKVSFNNLGKKNDDLLATRVSVMALKFAVITAK